MRGPTCLATSRCRMDGYDINYDDGEKELRDAGASLSDGRVSGGGGGDLSDRSVTAR